MSSLSEVRALWNNQIIAHGMFFLYHCSHGNRDSPLVASVRTDVLWLMQKCAHSDILYMWSTETIVAKSLFLVRTGLSLIFSPFSFFTLIYFASGLLCFTRTLWKVKRKDSCLYATQTDHYYCSIAFDVSLWEKPLFILTCSGIPSQQLVGYFVELLKRKRNVFVFCSNTPVEHAHK